LPPMRVLRPMPDTARSPSGSFVFTTAISADSSAWPPSPQTCARRRSQIFTGKTVSTAPAGDVTSDASLAPSSRVYTPSLIQSAVRPLLHAACSAGSPLCVLARSSGYHHLQTGHLGLAGQLAYPHATMSFVTLAGTAQDAPSFLELIAAHRLERGLRDAFSYALSVRCAQQWEPTSCEGR